MDRRGSRPRSLGPRSVAPRTLTRLFLCIVGVWIALTACVHYQHASTPPRPRRPLDRARDGVPSERGQTIEGEDAAPWWEPHAEAASVIYRPSNGTDWCGGPGEARGVVTATTAEASMPRTGLYLTKVMKTASSTAAGVSLQIAEAVARRRGRDGLCPHHVAHSWVTGRRGGSRRRGGGSRPRGTARRCRARPYFVWTVVRRPHERSISEFFFKDVSRNGRAYNASALIRLLERQKNYMIEVIENEERALAPCNVSSVRRASPEPAPWTSHEELRQRVSRIFRAHDFVAVAERMDESLVVMKLLHDFPDEAMVVFDSKRGGGFDDGNRGKCHRIQRSYTTPDVDAYVAGDEYRRTNGDYLLHAAAVRSLDRTVAALGPARVAREVRRHRALRREAEGACRATTRVPCARDGQRPDRRNDCYRSDWACGHACAMAVVARAAAAARPRHDEGRGGEADVTRR